MVKQFSLLFSIQMVLPYNFLFPFLVVSPRKTHLGKYVTRFWLGQEFGVLFKSSRP